MQVYQTFIQKIPGFFALFMLAGMLSSASAAPVNITYKVFGSGLYISSGQMTLDMEQTSFQQRAILQAEGPLKKIYDYDLSAMAQGRLDGDDVQPGFYQLTTVAAGTTQKTTLQYMPPATTPQVELSKPTSRQAVPDEWQRSDPLAAALSLAAGAQPNTTQQAVAFDGKRSFALALACGQSQDLHLTGAGAYKGESLPCDLTVEQNGGFKKGKAAKSALTAPVRLWLAPITTGTKDLYIPIKIHAHTTYGDIIAYGQVDTSVQQADAQ